MKKDVKTNRHTPTPHESSVNTPGNFLPTIPKGSHPLSDYIAESYVKYSEKKKKRVPLGAEPGSLKKE